MVQEALPQQRLSKIHQSLVKFQCFHGFPLEGTTQVALSCLFETIHLELS